MLRPKTPVESYRDNLCSKKTYNLGMLRPQKPIEPTDSFKKEERKKYAINIAERLLPSAYC